MAIIPESSSPDVFRSVRECLERHIPFAVCIRPEEDKADFFAGSGLSSMDEGDTGSWFEIGKWLEPYCNRVRIPHCDLLNIPSISNIPVFQPGRLPAIALPPVAGQPSISKKEYLSAVKDIAQRCGSRGGKTVYSRVISGENPDLDIPQAAINLFNKFRDSFRFLYYTHETGCWLGATPETLLDYDFSTRRASTMALAGTRPATESGRPWDGKNLKENDFVTDFICQQFRKINAQPIVSGIQTITYGNIQHIKRDISAILPDNSSYHQLIDLLNPTPALCGTPRHEAIADINDFELHRRECYGGFIGVRDIDTSTGQPSRLHCFVNIRSAHLSTFPPGHFDIFAGGGIISDSDSETEWAETTAKASRLLKVLSATRY